MFVLYDACVCVLLMFWSIKSAKDDKMEKLSKWKKRYVCGGLCKGLL